MSDEKSPAIEPQEPKVFSTRDLPFAAALVCYHFEMLGVDYQIEGNKRLPVGYFRFYDTLEMREFERKYIQGAMKVEPKQFMSNYRGLKGQVNSTYSSPSSNFNTSS
jgi:hypothetical protein